METFTFYLAEISNICWKKWSISSAAFRLARWPDTWEQSFSYSVPRAPSSTLATFTLSQTSLIHIISCSIRSQSPSPSLLCQSASYKHPPPHTHTYKQESQGMDLSARRSACQPACCASARSRGQRERVVFIALHKHVVAFCYFLFLFFRECSSRCIVGGEEPVRTAAGEHNGSWQRNICHAGEITRSAVRFTQRKSLRHEMEDEFCAVSTEEADFEGDARGEVLVSFQAGTRRPN